jgi:hypothetical protein
MHSAPSVSYPVGRSRFAAILLLLVWLMGLAVCTAWWVELHGTGWRAGASGLAAAAAGVAAARMWWQSPSGTLDWDGQAWTWSADQAGGSGTLEVALDLQHWLLLHWSDNSASQWLCVERASRVDRWDDLRRAAYSRARPKVPPEVGTSAPNP